MHDNDKEACDSKMTMMPQEDTQESVDVGMTLFEAIECEDEAAIAAILQAIMQAAFDNGWPVEHVIQMLEGHDIALGDSLKEWIKQQYTLLQEAQ